MSTKFKQLAGRHFFFRFSSKFAANFIASITTHQSIRMTMKKALPFMIMILSVVSLAAQVENEVVTGAGYTDDVFYSLGSGVVATEARDNWDLAFNTSNFSVSILANLPSKVEVYTWPLGDTADWATLDTTGMTWEPLYNSIETFDEGAFSYNATGHPDYGWGKYNDVTHIITGDSLYIVKTLAGEYKKMQILERNPITNNYTFKVAGLDGSDEQTVVLNTADYTAKTFVYYSLDNMEILDREPAKESWDLLFTRYFDYTIPYNVSGVLTNELHILSQEVKEEGLDQATFVDYEETAFSPDISTIGSDWKSFNMTTFSYDVDTTVVYFLKKYLVEDDSAYYKIYFTAFDYTEGKYVFVEEELSAVSNRAPEASMMLNLYPNPASDQLNVVYDVRGDMEVNIFDVTGRNVLSTLERASGFNTLTLDISTLENGLFFLKVKAGDQTSVQRFIKQ
jgi:hypothetical protein